jgi:hypothetical protein
VRYNSLCHNPPKPASGKEVPDLEEFIKKAKGDGSLDKTRKTMSSTKSTPAAARKPSTKKAGASTPLAKGDDSEDEDEVATPTLAFGNKRKASAAKGRGRKKNNTEEPEGEEEEEEDLKTIIKVEASDQDAVGETDNEEAGVIMV